MMTIIGGPMFSGKTTWLLDHIKKLPGGTFQLFKPGMDKRYAADKCVSHTGVSFPAMNLDTENPHIPRLVSAVKTILIDELNFFHPEKLISELQKQMNAGKAVIAAGLLYDFRRQPFGATLPLSKIAKTYIPLYASCDYCGGLAEYNYRKVAGDSQVLLGAQETYGVCCNSCWDQIPAS